MTLYCVVFMKQTEDDNTEHKYFVYALTEQEAIQRFCVTTGYSKHCIISTHISG